MEEEAELEQSKVELGETKAELKELNQLSGMCRIPANVNVPPQIASFQISPGGGTRDVNAYK